MPLPPLVLASSSPRRVALLAALGVTPVVRPARVDETPTPGEDPTALARRLARVKAEAVAQRGEVVVGADTVVVLDGVALGKPVDRAEGEAMLRRLSGRTHAVVTGVAVVHDRRAEVTSDVTTVTFRSVDDDEVAWYSATGEAMDKAGGYGIQGAGSLFVAGIDGSYANVVGLPVVALDALCRRLGWPLRAWSGRPPGA